MYDNHWYINVHITYHFNVATDNSGLFLILLLLLWLIIIIINGTLNIVIGQSDAILTTSVVF